MSIMEHSGKSLKSPHNSYTKSSDIQVTALNMQVETLRWQLEQTEANRQMHIALLKQVMTFLNRVKEHIEYQKSNAETREALPAKVLPASDLPRSKSVFHVNKSTEYVMTPVKKIHSRKISKSISNVNGCKESAVWTPSKTMTYETESTHKITEEMARLITLANTVLSTKLPDLACTCSDENILLKTVRNDKLEIRNGLDSVHLKVIEEDSNNSFVLNTVCNGEDPYNDIKGLVETRNKNLKDFLKPPLMLNCSLENDLERVKINEKENHTLARNYNAGKIKTEKKNDYIHSNYTEDESGFSSMSSFQEIGIPIISIIPPSPCKDVGFMEGIADVLDNTEKTEDIEVEKQDVKVLWV